MSFARRASATATLVKLTLSLECVGLAALIAAPGAQALIVRRHEQCIYVCDCCSRRVGDWCVSFVRDNLAYTAVAGARPTLCASNGSAPAALWRVHRGSLE